MKTCQLANFAKAQSKNPQITPVISLPFAGLFGPGCPNVKGGLLKGLPENDVTREAQTLLWDACPACKHDFGRWVAEWPDFAQKLLEAGFHCV